MRESIRDKDRLKHILLAIKNIDLFLKDKEEKDIHENPILYHAIVNNLSIIGEASYKLSKEFIENHPQTPWKHIISMRHFLVHGYYQISKKMVWDTAKNDLQNLYSQVNQYLEE